MNGWRQEQQWRKSVRSLSQQIATIASEVVIEGKNQGPVRSVRPPPLEDPPAEPQRLIAAMEEVMGSTRADRFVWLQDNLRKLGFK